MNWLKSLFSSILIPRLKNFWAMFFPQAKQIILGDLLDIALTAVNTLKNSDLSNDNRRKEAFKLIKESAKKNGIEAKDSLINLAIELAVQSWKS